MKVRPRFPLLLVGLLTLLALPGTVSAQEVSGSAPAPQAESVVADVATDSADPSAPLTPLAVAQATNPGVEVPDAAQAAKLAELEGLLAEDERLTRRWWRFWSLLQAGLIVGQVTYGYFAIDNSDERAAYYLNAGASGIGLLSLLVMRPPALKASERVLSLPDTTPEERAHKLEAAEAFVQESGDAQAFGTGWAPYTGGAVVGLAVALPLWFRFDRKLDAGLAFMGSMLFTTVQTVTTPVRARNYTRRRPVEVSLGVSLGGLSVTGAF